MQSDHANAPPSQPEQRAIGKRARRDMCDVDRQSASRIITEYVTRSNWFQRCEYLACYLPLHSEVDTWEIIARAWQMKKRVFAPVVEKNLPIRFREIRQSTVLIADSLGILEPIAGEFMSARRLDVVLAPVVAFDAARHRIGMGGGYYDRTFGFLRHRQHYFLPKLVGLAFACQQVEKIAPNPWDIRLFSVITETSQR